MGAVGNLITARFAFYGRDMFLNAAQNSKLATRKTNFPIRIDVK